MNLPKLDCSYEKKKIIVVDDDPDILNWFGTLEDDKSKFKFYFLNDELKIMELVNNLDPDMVFVDICLNSISGKNVGEIIKLSSIFKLPIVYMSAKPVWSNNMRGSAVFDEYFLKKPLDKRVVEDTIAKMLRL